MTKYVTIELQTMDNGTVANIVTSHDTLDAAASTYHSILAAAAISNLPAHAAVLIDNYGVEIESQCYYHGAGE